MNAFIYYTATGEIVRVLVAEAPDPNESMPHVVADAFAGITAASHYVLNGELVEHTPEQRSEYERRPPFRSHWDPSIPGWVDDRSAEEREESRRRAIIARIAEIESKQDRAVREALLGSPERLLAIESEIAALRRQL